MQLLLTLSAKRYSDLKDFLYFLQENSLLEKDLFRPTLQKVHKEKFTWTLLKSPHVNKTAREQFSLDHYKIKLTIQIESVNRFILIFKKLPNSLVSKVSTQLCLYTFNDSIVVLRDNKNITSATQNSLLKMIKYDIFGERCLSLRSLK